MSITHIGAGAVPMLTSAPLVAHTHNALPVIHKPEDVMGIDEAVILYLLLKNMHQVSPISSGSSIGSIINSHV